MLSITKRSKPTERSSRHETKGCSPELEHFRTPRRTLSHKKLPQSADRFRFTGDVAGCGVEVDARSTEVERTKFASSHSDRGSVGGRLDISDAVCDAESVGAAGLTHVVVDREYDLTVLLVSAGRQRRFDIENSHIERIANDPLHRSRV